MKRLKMLRIVVSIVMLLFAMGISAQSNGDKLFMEGQKLQQTRTIAAQNQAIKKFKAAKVVYTAAEKKTMCDNQIAICNSNIAALKNSNRPLKQGSVEQEKEPDFSLSSNEVVFDGGKADFCSVVVKSDLKNWIVTLPEDLENKNFAKVSRSNDSLSIYIEVEANPLTIERHQTINVTLGDKTETITVTQRKKPVTLSASTNFLEFNLKGKGKSFELYTNSDSIVPSNNNLTWYVESKPEWIDINLTVKKTGGVKKFFADGLTAGKKLISGSTAELAEDVKVSDITISATPLLKSDSEYFTGRRGEVVFASQDKRFKLIVIQQK